MIAIVFVLVSFNKVSSPEPFTDDSKVYFKFSLNGPKENGVFTAEAEPNDIKSIQHKVVSTTAFKTGSINLMDFNNKAFASLKFPVNKGLFELLEANSQNFILTINVNKRLFTSKSVSVHITDLVENTSNPLQLSLIKGKFEGVMKHSFTEDRKSKEETYTIHGEFQYISPKYQKQLKKKR